MKKAKSTKEIKRDDVMKAICESLTEIGFVVEPAEAFEGDYTASTLIIDEVVQIKLITPKANQDKYNKR